MNDRSDNTLSYRIGTYDDFLKTQLSTLAVTPAKTESGDIISLPWKAYDINENGNPISALMQGWSMVLDVLTFYQERLLNEGLLQTAKEQRSILELGNEVGYQFNKGLPATTYLAFTAAKPKKPLQPIAIPHATAAKAIPIDKGSLGQIFETTNEATIYYEWNSISVKSLKVQTQLANEVIPTTTVLVKPLKHGSSINEDLLVQGNLSQPKPIPATISTSTNLHVTAPNITPETTTIGRMPGIKTNSVTLPYTRPQIITDSSTAIILEGTTTQLKKGDLIVLIGHNTLEDNSTTHNKASIHSEIATLEPKWYAVAVVAKTDIDQKQKTTTVTWCSPLTHLFSLGNSPAPTQWSTTCKSVQALKFPLQTSLYGYKAPDWNKLTDKQKLNFQDNIVYSISTTENKANSNKQYSVSSIITDVIQLPCDGLAKDNHSTPDFQPHTFISSLGGGIVANIEKKESKDSSSWKPVNEGLDSLNITAIEYINASGNHHPVLFATSQDNGLFCSSDKGGIWHSANGGLYTDNKTGITSPRKVISPITNTLAKKDNFLVVGTSMGLYLLSTQTEASLPSFAGTLLNSGTTSALERLIQVLSTPDFTLTEAPKKLPVSSSLEVAISPGSPCTLSNGFSFSTSANIPSGNYTFTFSSKGPLFDIEIAHATSTFNISYTGLDLTSAKLNINTPPFTLTSSTSTPSLNPSLQTQTLQVQKKGTASSITFTNNLLAKSSNQLTTGTYKIVLNTATPNQLSYSITRCYPLGSLWDSLPLLPRTDLNVTSILLCGNDSDSNSDSNSNSNNTLTKNINTQSLTIYAGTSKGNIYSGVFEPSSPKSIHSLQTFLTEQTSPSSVSSIIQANKKIYAGFKNNGIDFLNEATSSKESIWPSSAETKEIQGLAYSPWDNIKQQGAEVSPCNTLFAATNIGLFINQSPNFSPDSWHKLDIPGVSKDIRSIRTFVTESTSLWLSCMPNQYPGFYINHNTVYLNQRYKSIIPSQTALPHKANHSEIVTNRSWALFSQATNSPTFSLKAIKSVDTVYHKEFGLPGSKVSRLILESSLTENQFSIRGTSILTESTELPIARIALPANENIQQSIKKAEHHSKMAAFEMDKLITPLSGVKPANIAKGLALQARTLKNTLENINFKNSNVTKNNLPKNNTELVNSLIETTKSTEKSLNQIHTTLSLPNISSDQPINFTASFFHLHRLLTTLFTINSSVRNANSVSLEGILELRSGQIICFTGKTQDSQKSVSSELAEIASISFTDKTTDITLTQGLSLEFVLKGLVVNANVIQVGQGQTVKNEILGSGNATHTHQNFTLKRSPLTYSDRDSNTLQVVVNGTLWHQVPSLIGQSSESRVYYLRSDEDGKTKVHFGDGYNGARLPSGLNNIVANYRFGMGRCGNVPPRSIKQLLNTPKGVKQVTNPATAVGGEDPESINQAKQNINYSNHYYERIISKSDYYYFCLAYPGISKVLVDELWTGNNDLTVITLVPSIDLAPRDINNNINQIDRALVIQRLQEAIFKRHQLEKECHLLDYQLVTFGVAINLSVDDSVDIYKFKNTVEQHLTKAFSVNTRDLAQNVTKSEILSVVQSINHVLCVEFTCFTHSQSTSHSGKSQSAHKHEKHNPHILYAQRATWNDKTQAENLAELMIIDASICQLNIQVPPN